jgi:isobutyryl-CoA mutase
MQAQTPYQPTNNIRIVTAASLFDGHDAAINIMRRIIQSTGAEVIHLGHNRSVGEVVDAAIQEDVQAIAMTSYQGGHLEYFRYMRELLNERGARHVKIFGGGGGTILPEEIAELHVHGIDRIYSPEDGRTMGLQGMINDLVQKADFSLDELSRGEEVNLLAEARNRKVSALARIMTMMENGTLSKSLQHTIEHDARGDAQTDGETDGETDAQGDKKSTTTPILGITGTGGAGKSSLTDELIRRFLLDFPDKCAAIVSIDPSKRKTGGALLGDRIRMNAINSPRIFMRSVATRQTNAAVSQSVGAMLHLLKRAAYDLIIVETAGIGQSGSEITDIADVSLYVMTPEFGAATQLEKIDMIDYADVIALNKFDKSGALDALRDVKKQFQRSRNMWDKTLNEMPVFGTMASQFNDPGMNTLYRVLMDTIVQKTGANLRSSVVLSDEMSKKVYIIPPNRTRYLAEIADEHQRYTSHTAEQTRLARKLYQLGGALEALKGQ